MVAIILLLDWYVYQGVKTICQSASEKFRIAIALVYWGITVLTVFMVLFYPWMQRFPGMKNILTYVFAIVLGLFFAKVLALIFLLIDDIRRGALWMMSKLFRDSGAHYLDSDSTIPRSAFLSWLGLGVGGTLFGTLVYGFSNKYNYHTRRLTLNFTNLPRGFDGFKFVQFSDVHAGSFHNKRAVARGVDMILREKPELVLFTGDLVNDRASEMQDYSDLFSAVKAPMGVFSTLGNHDYGDYTTWNSAAEKERNLTELKKIHAGMGWNLLMNEHSILRRNGDEIALLGIENWSAKARFPKHGRMDLAYPGTEKYPFKMLMSHDPSHWDAQVRPHYPKIDLTLSGHTHGMQFGVELPHFKWSPVQWVYKQWAGLYEEGSQKLYVNRGFGFIGYPGRVGILPEITVFTLRRS